MLEISRKKLTLILEALEHAALETRSDPLLTEWSELDYQLADSIADIKEVLGMS